MNFRLAQVVFPVAIVCLAGSARGDGPAPPDIRPRIENGRVILYSGETTPTPTPNDSVRPVVVRSQPADPQVAPPLPSGSPPTSTFDQPADPSEKGHLLAGGGFYFIRPFFDKNPIFTTAFTNGPSSSVVSDKDFNWDYNFVPRVWLGYETDSGFGLRTQFWHFDQSTTTALINTDTSGNFTITSAAPLGLSFSSPGLVLFKQGVDRLFFDSDLKMDVVDLEASQDFRFGRWSALLTGGARYAHLAQDYNGIRIDPPVGAGGVLPGCNPSGTQPKKCLAVTPPPPGGGAGPVPIVVIEDVDMLQSGHNFNGVGPTFSIGLQRALGDTAFALFSNFRGSVLFGRSRQRASLTGILIGQFVVPPGPNIPFSAATFESHEASSDEILPVAELEIGAEWGRTWRGLYLFAQTALAAQIWFDAGTASSEKGDLALFGLSVMAGIGY